MYQVYSVIRTTTGEGRPQVFKAWGPWSGAGEGVDGGSNSICAAFITLQSDRSNGCGRHASVYHANIYFKNENTWTRLRCFRRVKNTPFQLAVRLTNFFFFLIKIQLWKMRVILRSRVLRAVYPRERYRSVTPLLVPGYTGQKRPALFCARKLNDPHFVEGD